MPSSRQYLICYDIKDPHRLKNVHKCVLKYAMSVQYSVYYGVLSIRDKRALIDQLMTLIDPSKDDVRIYQVGKIEDALKIGGNLTMQTLSVDTIMIF